MLGQALTQLINDKSEQEKAEFNAKSAAEQADIVKKVGEIETVIQSIKDNIALLADKKKKAIIIGNLIETTDTDTLFGSKYSNHIYSSKVEIDFFAFYKGVSGLPIHDLIAEFKTWVVDNGFETVIIQNNHCGGGMKSWNSYWIKTIPAK